MESAAPPVFLAATPKSGAALLYALLCRHPRVTWASNWDQHAPRLARLARRARLTALAHGPLRLLLPQPSDGEHLFAAYDVDGVAAAEPLTRQQAGLRRVVEELSGLSAGGVFVSFSAAHTSRIWRLHRVFPDARFITLVRDGRAVAASLLAAGQFPEGTGRPPLERAARHWVRAVESLEGGLARVPTSQILQLGYEELIADPATHTDRVAEFAGLGADPAWRRRLARVRPSERDEDGWPTRLGEPMERVQAIQESWLRKYGYLR